MIEATAAKEPIPKITKRAIFSCFGRWMPLSVFRGKSRIQKSVKMLNAEVAATLLVLHNVSRRQEEDIL